MNSDDLRKRLNENVIHSSLAPTNMDRIVISYLEEIVKRLERIEKSLKKGKKAEANEE